MKTIKSNSYSVFFEEKQYHSLENYLQSSDYSLVVILVDANTKKYCLPIFLSKIPVSTDYRILEIPSGEQFKTLETCSSVWKELTDLQVDRKTLIFHLGGGVVTDLGGFTASTFKRGVRFINFPTTLLAMVDASIGGKTGIDFNGLKNQIGLFSNPELLIIDVSYLKTLPQKELYSGLAEVIKYGITFDEKLWKSIKQSKNISEKILKEWIFRSVSIKNEIVLQDPKEAGIRKILNFGHTIGHAIESYFLVSQDKNTLTHGEAIAAGMLMETYISTKLFDFSLDELKTLEKVVFTYFEKINFNTKDFSHFLEWMQHDKKNINGQILFSLLKDVGVCQWNIKVPEELVMESFNYYLNL